MRAIAAAALILANLAVAAAAGDAPILPDHNLTPGDTLPVSVETLCIPGYAKACATSPAGLRRVSIEPIS